MFEFDEKLHINTSANNNIPLPLAKDKLVLTLPLPLQLPQAPHVPHAQQAPHDAAAAMATEPRRNYSDPLISPSLISTPNTNQHPTDLAGGTSKGSNYTHYSHQHQNSLSSLNSSIFNPTAGSLTHGVSGSSTTVSDMYGAGAGAAGGSGNCPYTGEPLTPPDYFNGHSGVFDSHSRKSSVSSSIWNQTPSLKLYSPWVGGGGGSGTGTGGATGGNTTANAAPTGAAATTATATATANASATATATAATSMGMGINTNNPGQNYSLGDLDALGLLEVPSIHSVPSVPSIPTLQHHHSSKSDISLDEQKFQRQRLLSLQQAPVNMASFEKQFQGLSMGSTALTDGSNSGISAQQSAQRRNLVSISSATVLDESTDILGLSKDQYGCRFLQKKIDEDFGKYYPLIFGEIYRHSTELMTDPFGNYLIQKIILNASCEELNLVLTNISPFIYSISKNQHGTRACQKLIDCLSTPIHHRLLEECLSPQIVNLIQDLNGNHVIQKCISNFQNEELQFIIDSICNNMIKIATHKHGCCVLQKLLNKANSEQVIQLGQEIVRNSIILMQDQFGNYVVQYLITVDIYLLNNELIKIMVPYICELSVQKFSSNVVEKCLKIRAGDDYNPLFEALLQPAILTTLIKDQYGNYVIQTAMDLSSPEYKSRFASSIKPLLPLVRFTSFGKRIYNKVMSILNDNEKSNDKLQQSFSQLLSNQLLPPIELGKGSNNSGDINEFMRANGVEKYL